MSITRRRSVRRAAARSRRAPRLHVLELEGRIAPAVFNIPDGDVAAFVAAINACNSNNQPDVINLATNGTYTFTTRADIESGGSALPVVGLDGGNTANSITINGQGATVQRSTVTGTPTFRFLKIGSNIPATADVHAVDVALSGLTIQGFDVSAYTDSRVPTGGVLNVFYAGNVHLSDCVMTNNRSGVISMLGSASETLALDRCQITDNFEYGIFVERSSLQISGSTLANTKASPESNSRPIGITAYLSPVVSITDSLIRNHPGSGLSLVGAENSSLLLNNCVVSDNGNTSSLNATDVTISGCTFARNAGQRVGGGASVGGKHVSIINCTFDGNTGGQGGGVTVGLPSNDADARGVISGCTIVNNRVTTFHADEGTFQMTYPALGGGVYIKGGPCQVYDTVIAGNTLVNVGRSIGAGPDVTGNVSALRYCLVGDGSGLVVSGPTTGSQIGTAGAPLDPRLGPLQDNGGPTPTRLPLPGSPLINAGDPNFTPPPQFDQRGPGFPRVRGGRIDIGATEAAIHDVAVTLTDARRIVLAGSTTTYTAVVRNSGDFTETGTTFTLPLPPLATGMTWASTAEGGAAGSTPSGTGPISDTLDLPLGASVTYTVTVTLSPTAAGQLVATAQAVAPTGVSEADLTNNTATDTDAVLVGGRILAVGMGEGGPPEVKLYGARDGVPLYSFPAYDPVFRGGVSVAVADFTADGVPDIVTAAGAGGAPQVRVFDGATGNVLREWTAYDPAFTGGVFVAGGDVTGDGTPDVVTGAGPGGGPHMKVFDGANGALVRQWMAYDTAFRGGVSVAAGDIDGDNRADVLTGAGPGGGPHVKVFSGATGALLTQAFAFEADFRGGVWVTAGDVDGDGRAEVITAPGEGGGPFVKVLRGNDLSLLRGFLAYDAAFRGGTRVAAVDATGDGKAEIVTAAGPGGGPHVRLFDGGTGSEVYGLMAFDPALRGGIFIGAG